MRRHDRLAALAACHSLLTFASLDPLSAYRSTSREQRARPHRYGPMIRDLVAEALPDVLRALWPPGARYWMAAGITGDPMVRILSVHRGPLGQSGGEDLSLTYGCRDPDDERPASQALTDALRDTPGGPT